MPSVLFSYDIVCPYAYLASTQIEALCARHDAALAFRPILLGGLLRTVGTPDPLATMPAAKARMSRLDALRWADHYGVPLRWPEGHPRRTVDAMRLLTAMPGPRRAALTRALYFAYWADGEDVADRAVLERHLGAPVAPLVDDPAHKQALRAATDSAAAEGLFGVPSFQVTADDGARWLFFGQDRLAFVDRVLGGWRPAGG
jgi:2-hydroxychromene-2-carboxylate isomerase